MRQRKFHLHDGKKGSALAIRITPLASRNEIVGVTSDGTIKIHIAAPPVEGRANEVLIKFLADILDVPKSRVEIVAGLSGRDKLVSILDMDVRVAHRKIIEQLG